MVKGYPILSGLVVNQIPLDSGVTFFYICGVNQILFIMRYSKSTYARQSQTVNNLLSLLVSYEKKAFLPDQSAMQATGLNQSDFKMAKDVLVSINAAELLSMRHSNSYDFLVCTELSSKALRENWVDKYFYNLYLDKQKRLYDSRNAKLHIPLTIVSILLSLIAVVISIIALFGTH